MAVPQGSARCLEAAPLAASAWQAAGAAGQQLWKLRYLEAVVGPVGGQECCLGLCRVQHTPQLHFCRQGWGSGGLACWAVTLTQAAQGPRQHGRRDGPPGAGGRGEANRHRTPHLHQRRYAGGTSGSGCRPAGRQAGWSHSTGSMKGKRTRRRRRGRQRARHHLRGPPTLPLSTLVTVLHTAPPHTLGSPSAAPPIGHRPAAQQVQQQRLVTRDVRDALPAARHRTMCHGGAVVLSRIAPPDAMQGAAERAEHDAACGRGGPRGLAACGSAGHTHRTRSRERLTTWPHALRASSQRE